MEDNAPTRSSSKKESCVPTHKYLYSESIFKAGAQLFGVGYDPIFGLWILEVPSSRLETINFPAFLSHVSATCFKNWCKKVKDRSNHLK